MGVVAEAADDIVVMYAGQIVEHALDARPLRQSASIRTPRRCSARCPQLEGEASARAADARSRAAAPRPARPARGVPLQRRAARYAGDDDCTEQMPELRELRTGHWVRSAHPASERVARRAPETTRA